MVALNSRGRQIFSASFPCASRPDEGVFVPTMPKSSLCGDLHEENGNYLGSSVQDLEFRVWGLGYIGTKGMIEKNVETIIISWGCMGIMGKKMETTTG